jgi:hypothetical protein
MLHKEFARHQSGAVSEEARPTGIEQSFELFMSMVAADSGAGVLRQLESAGTTSIGPGLQTLLEQMRGSVTSGADVLALLVRWGPIPHGHWQLLPGVRCSSSPVR